MRYFFCMLAVLTSMASVNAGEIRMKEIQYHGGLVTFSVPKNWVERYEPDGGGMFYEDAPNKGTLRLNVLTAKSPKPLPPDAAFEEVMAIKGVSPKNAQRLKNGNAIATSVQHTTEQGQAITLFWWHVTNPVRPSHLRIASFSFTVLTSQESSEGTKREVQLLTESIKNAKFHPTLGQ